MLNLTGICMLCLTTNQKLQNMYSEDVDGTLIIERIKDFISGEANLKTYFPKYVCSSCLLNINYINEFRQKCIDNIASITDYVAKLNAANDKPSAQHFLIIVSDTNNEKKDPLQLENQNNTAQNETNCQSANVVNNIINEETNVLHDNIKQNQANSPQDAIQIEKPQSPEHVTVKIEQENSFSDIQTSYEVFKELNEEKVIIDENIINNSNIPDEITCENPDVSTNFSVRDCYVKVEPLKNAGLEEEYLSSSTSCSSESEADNNFLEDPQSSSSKIIKFEEANLDDTKYETAASNDGETSTQPSVPTTSKFQFMCPECHQQFCILSDLITHRRIHFEDRPHVCKTCNKTFKQEELLKIHSLIHKLDKTYVCELCRKKFRVLSTFHKHQRLHEIPPFICVFCKKSFDNYLDLAGHMKSHSDEESFRCGLCDYKTGNKSTLKSHIQLHNKFFECDLCESKFNRQDQLNRHKKKHIEYHQCSVCNKKFKTKSNLNKHFRIKCGKDDCSTMNMETSSE